jgi:flavin reductase (DIM6/NTAB) family NADH-FMN oxidoreductase RutF
VLRRGTFVVIAAVLIPLGVAVATLGALVHPATVHLAGVPLPAGLVIAMAAEATLLLAGGTALGSRWGAALPAGTWLLTVLALSLPRPEGDLIIAANPAGYAFLLLGTVVAGLSVSLVPVLTLDNPHGAHPAGDRLWSSPRCWPRAGSVGYVPPEPVDPPPADPLAPLTGLTPRVPPEAFRAALGRFATGVTVVTAVVDGIDHAMTASALASVSLEPPLVLVCVAHRARFHDAITVAGEWGLSVLPATARGAAAWFATRGRPLDGQMAGFALVRGPQTGAALLADAIVTAECRTWATYDGGDHSIVVGEVLAVDVRRPGTRPLLHFHGGYHTLGPQV